MERNYYIIRKKQNKYLESVENKSNSESDVSDTENSFEKSESKSIETDSSSSTDLVECVNIQTRPKEDANYSDNDEFITTDNDFEIENNDEPLNTEESSISNHYQL